MTDLGDPHTYAVIMAGGGGTRFWPLSRRHRPKQFLPIVGTDSMLRQTWERCVAVVGDPERVLVVTAASYVALTVQELPELPPANLLAEPQARNTAPCLAWAAAVLAQRDPEAMMLVFPADHVVLDVAGLARTASAAAAAARQGHLVTFGVPPRYAETGYGYIETGAALELDGATVALPVCKVVAFREKPNLQTAESYVADGYFLWNSASRDDAYRAMPATSIDYGVMERADNVACVKAEFDWSDVGSWEALQELVEGDEFGNVVEGQVVALDASDNLVHAPEDMVALLGVKGLAIVRAGGVLLVAPLDRSQQIKALRDKVAEASLDRFL
jgi:mannose-1-phosphate guanylyltransferase